MFNNLLQIDAPKLTIDVSTHQAQNLFNPYPGVYFASPNDADLIRAAFPDDSAIRFTEVDHLTQSAVFRTLRRLSFQVRRHPTCHILVSSKMKPDIDAQHFPVVEDTRATRIFSGELAPAVNLNPHRIVQSGANWANSAQVTEFGSSADQVVSVLQVQEQPILPISRRPIKSVYPQITFTDSHRALIKWLLNDRSNSQFVFEDVVTPTSPYALKRGVRTAVNVVDFDEKGTIRARSTFDPALLSVSGDAAAAYFVPGGSFTELQVPLILAYNLGPIEACDLQIPNSVVVYNGSLESSDLLFVNHATRTLFVPHSVLIKPSLEDMLLGLTVTDFVQWVDTLRETNIIGKRAYQRIMSWMSSNGFSVSTLFSPENLVHTDRFRDDYSVPPATVFLLRAAPLTIDLAGGPVAP